jgi:hypothetical protein
MTSFARRIPAEASVAGKHSLQKRPVEVCEGFLSYGTALAFEIMQELG